MDQQLFQELVGLYGHSHRSLTRDLSCLSLMVCSGTPTLIK